MNDLGLILGISVSVILLLGFSAICDYLFEMGVTKRIRAALEPLLLRRRRRIARARERRRVAALSPLESMVEYKRQRRQEESMMWVTRLREVMPEPHEWDYEGRRRERDLFSGDRHSIGRALTPEGGTARYQREPGAGHDDLVVRSADGTEIVRIPAQHRP